MSTFLSDALTTASIKELHDARNGLSEFGNRRETSQKMVDIAAEVVFSIEQELANRTPATCDDSLYKLLGLLDDDDLSNGVLSAVKDARILLAA